MALTNLPGREEYLRKKRKRKLFKYGVLVFLAVFIIASVSYISHQPKIRIGKVKLSGGVLVTQDDVESKSLEYLRESYMWLFPKNNIFLYPRKGLEKYLKETFKRIDTISIHRNDFQTLDIKITERKPTALWCGTIVSDTEHCYFMDQNSAIFAPAPKFSGDAYFKYYGLVETDPIGKYYISSTTEFAEISDFIQKLKELSLGPQYLVPKGTGQFSVVLSGGGEIYFNVNKEPLSKVLANLEALLRTSELSNKTKGNLPIEYIDLRYGNKLFYKLKNQ